MILDLSTIAFRLLPWLLVAKVTGSKISYANDYKSYLYVSKPL